MIMPLNEQLMIIIISFIITYYYYPHNPIYFTFAFTTFTPLFKYNLILLFVIYVMMLFGSYLSHRLIPPSLNNNDVLLQGLDWLRLLKTHLYAVLYLQ